MLVVPLAEAAKHLPALVQILAQGGVIVYPTDTLYGLGCDIFSESGIERIWQIKGRSARKPISMVCTNLKQVHEYAVIDEYASRLMKQVLPGPFTIVLPATPKAPPSVCSEKGRVGIRIPRCQMALDLAANLGRPITSTSVNKAGQPPLTDPKEIARIFFELDAIIDAGELSGSGSTVIDVTGEEINVIREGVGGVGGKKVDLGL